MDGLTAPFSHVLDAVYPSSIAVSSFLTEKGAIAMVHVVVAAIQVLADTR
jgi:hypothetical protein